METAIKRWIMRPIVRPMIVGGFFVTAAVIAGCSFMWGDDLIKTLYHVHPALGIATITVLGSGLIYGVGRYYLLSECDLTHMDLVKASRAFNEEQKLL
jgi:hypothetical protein